MAEKEERIYVGKLTGNNYTCVIGGVCSGKKCGNCKFGMTRQDAIERMAKAICKETCACPYYVCGNCTEFLEHYYPDIAEAALNALLGVNK